MVEWRAKCDGFSFERMKSTGMVQKRVVHKVNFFTVFCFSDCNM